MINTDRSIFLILKNCLFDTHFRIKKHTIMHYDGFYSSALIHRPNI